MNPETLKQLRGVTNRQWHMQLGNAMSVIVVERLLARLLPAAGMTGELQDRWASGEALAEFKATRACEGSREKEQVVVGTVVYPRLSTKMVPVRIYFPSSRSAAVFETWNSSADEYFCS